MEAIKIEINVPTFFVCPISLEIMRDPVILSSGVTYDRDSIEKWLFSGKHVTCPVTKQVISGDHLTPNHTLRRLIQAWCTVNAVDRIPTPKPPVTKPQVVKLLHNMTSDREQVTCLRSLRALAAENATNKRCIEASGAVEFLASVIVNYENTPASPIGEALTTLYSLQISDSGLRSLLGKDNGAFVHALTRVMKSGEFGTRSHAVLMLKSLLHVAEPRQLIALTSDLFGETVRAIRDRISRQATKAALEVLVGACAWGRNRVKAVEAGATAALVDLLLEHHSGERRMNEMALVVLDSLCGCAEGRAELVEHAAGVAVVGRKILRVSAEGSERAVRVLQSVSKYSGSGRVVEEMLRVGVAAKLCLVLQAECGSKTKEKAKEILKSHARAWRNSPCIPSHLQTSYPA